jgi:hypothetical protein
MRIEHSGNWLYQNLGFETQQGADSWDSQTDPLQRGQWLFLKDNSGPAL